MRKFAANFALALTLLSGASALAFAAPQTESSETGQDPITQVTSTSPMAKMVFTHKCNSKYDRTMDLAKLQSMYRFMPHKLKREIGQVYYPALREDLHKGDSTVFMEAEAGKRINRDGTMTIDLSFPKFWLTMDHITWQDLDALFLTYFQEK